MAVVTEEFLETWRSGQHVGANRPHQVVQIRRGSFRRDYREWHPRLNIWIPGETRNLPWYPIFTETTPWVDVPNVSSVELAQASGDQNGCSVATIALDNVWYEALSGPGGDYHAISPGYLAAYRGEDPVTRPASRRAANGWSRVLTKNANVRIWQGFGPPVLVDDEMPEDGGENGAWVFNGLIDDVDWESNPATATITARMGKTLTDEHVFGWVKSKQLLDPIVFADRLHADDVKEVGQRATASSRADGHSPAYVLDKDNATSWLPASATSDTNVEWVEIRVSEGRYTDIKLRAGSGAAVYVAVFPKATADGQCKRDGTSITPNVWQNPDFNPTLPNTSSGAWTYARQASDADGTDQVVSLGGEYFMGADSIIRVGVKGSDSHVYTLKGRHRKRPTDKLILIDDASDMVRAALRWGGYLDWEVEDTGVRLADRLVFNRANFLIDIVNKAIEMTGFTFFIADPVDGSSMGVPVFRRSSALLREGGPPAPSSLRVDDNADHAIPDDDPAGVDVSFVVAPSGPVNTVHVSFYISHTYDADLQISLIDPDDTEVLLVDRHGFGFGGSSTVDFGTSATDADRTIIIDTATTPVGDGSGPFVGEYQPDNPLSGFGGLEVHGTWKLHVVDTGGGDVGTIHNASLFLTYHDTSLPPAQATASVVLEVRDDDLLTGLRVRESEESLAYILRTRGKEIAAQDGGLTLGGEKITRVMSVYRPPWTQDNSMAGIIKHSVRTDPVFTTLADCIMGNYLTAIAEALEAVTATAPMPGNPYPELDDQLGILDENTGTNQRLLVTNRNSTFTDGEEVSWISTLAGPLVDNHYLVAVIDEVLRTDFGSAPSPIRYGDPRPLRIR